MGHNPGNIHLFELACWIWEAGKVPRGLHQLLHALRGVRAGALQYMTMIPKVVNGLQIRNRPSEQAGTRNLWE